MSAAFVIEGYCRRWGMEVALAGSEPLFGLHDPQVRTGASVERAHPLAWFVQTLTVVWYAEAGTGCPGVQRDRPCYRSKAGVSFADRLGNLRLQQWELRFSREATDGQSPRKCSTP